MKYLIETKTNIQIKRGYQMIHTSIEGERTIGIPSKIISIESYDEENEKEVGLLYKDAIDTWGQNPQMLMAIEEMAELTKVICHHFRDNRNFELDDIITEVADVKIMMEQLIYMFDIKLDVENEMKKKHEKLKRYLKE